VLLLETSQSRIYRVQVVEHVRDEQRVEGGDVSAAEGVGPPAAGAGASSAGGQATHLVWRHEREVRHLYILMIHCWTFTPL
jgi:hypothetical protein